MKTAEEILRENGKPYLGGPNVENIIIGMMKDYAEEALREAAEKVKIKWIDDEYDEERHDMISHPEIDNASILNIIKELK